MKKILRNNSLSIVFMLLFIFSLVGQIAAGYYHHNNERVKEGQHEVGLPEYMVSGHFIQATFENWESEFLQMALFVVLTVSLRQKGSSESKSVEGEEEVDRAPDPDRKDAPWPIKKGGWISALYQRSLSIVLFFLFFVSFGLHIYGSLKDENEQRLAQGLAPENLSGYLGESRFWFESFQNWQSEFLSVFAIVVLSIYLRQKGSPQSKPVDAPHFQTGE
jgi:hypothetical protein